MRLALALALCLLAARAETAEVMATRIDWRRDGLRAVFNAAAEDGKPLVIVTEGDAGRFFTDVLNCPTFNRLADDAHFVLVKLPVNEASEAGRLVNALHIDPVFASSLVVLRANPMVEILRLRGYRNEAALLGKLDEAGLSVSRDALPVSAGDDGPRDCVN